MAVLLAVAAAVAVLVSSDPAPVRAQTAPQRPNFVVIVADDLSKRMYERSTSLRRGSETEGIDFVSAFAPTPLCCSARATILTGRYAHHHGVRHNGYRSSDLSRKLFGAERRFLERGLETRTIAHLPSRAGYSTGLVGKYMNGYGRNDGGPGGNDPQARPDEPSEEGSHRRRVPRGLGGWHAWTGTAMN